MGFTLDEMTKIIGGKKRGANVPDHTFENIPHISTWQFLECQDDSCLTGIE